MNSRRTKRSEKQGRGERYIQLNTEFQRIAGRNKKAFFNEHGLIIEENNKIGKIGDLSGKLEMSRGHSTQRWAQQKIKMVET